MQSEEKAGSDNPVSVRELMRYDDLEFVVNAYHHILAREPDRMGLAHYLLELRSGLSDRIEVIGNLRFSPEGRAKGVKVDGLLWPYSWKLVRRSPRYAFNVAQEARRRFLSVRRSRFVSTEKRLTYFESRLSSIEDATALLLSRLSAQEAQWNSHLPTIKNALMSLRSFGLELEHIDKLLEGRLRDEWLKERERYDALAEKQVQQSAKQEAPSFSIVINTDGRAKSLGETLEALQYLDYPLFEICVVRGPTEDGTVEVLRRWQDRLKIAECPERNLSMSRNIGIAIATGDIVAFIDDDAIPEVRWLRDLAPAFDDPAVAGAGGIVYDYTKTKLQHRFETANRLGSPDPNWSRSAPELCFPLTANFPNLIGTNCAFRRNAILAIGGFDEEFEYYLDETDLCCRLVDAGWKISQLSDAPVHHRWLPSDIRDEQRTIVRWYPMVKNKIYFSLMNSGGHFGVAEIIEDARRFINEYSEQLTAAIAEGKLSADDCERFRIEVEQAWRDGMERGLRGTRRQITDETLRRFARPFLQFDPLS
jgi:GT2 family glycosyltransferase